MRTAVVLICGLVIGLLLGVDVAERQASAAEASTSLPPIFRAGKWVSHGNVKLRVRDVFGEWFQDDAGQWIHVPSSSTWSEVPEPTKPK